jgi:uncharacterized C2H2 Zn-finger protein
MSYFYFNPYEAAFPYFFLPSMLHQNVPASCRVDSDSKIAPTLSNISESTATLTPEAPQISVQTSENNKSQESKSIDSSVSESKPATSTVRCPNCNQVFKNIKGLKQHTGRMHKKSPKKSVCKFCSKKFKNQYAVKSHIKQVHEQSTKVECEICHRMIYNKYELKKHMAREHQG